MPLTQMIALSGTGEQRRDGAMRGKSMSKNDVSPLSVNPIGGSCGSIHHWVWAGNPNYELPEGTPCACGAMLWHTEKCLCCGNISNKPVER